MIDLTQIEAARKRISNRVLRTPTDSSDTLNRQTSLDLSFKMELFQKTGSFKVRGVLNKLARLPEQTKKTGVVSMSSGNHAQALSFGAAQFGIPATIVMPTWSRAGKVEATRAYGGEVILTDEPLMDVCSQIGANRGLTFVHPFDDDEIMAGHGTVGLELLEDVPKMEGVLVSIGGGGLISGIATAIKARSPSTRVIGVEPEGAPAMSESLRLGRPVTLESTDTIADGLAAPFAGRKCLEHVKQFVDEVLIVKDQDIIDAMGLIMERCKVVAEPSAAAALVPLLDGSARFAPGSRVVCVLCGGNIDRKTLGDLLGG